MNPVPPSDAVPWFTVILWGTVVVLGSYALFLLLNVLFPPTPRLTDMKSPFHHGK